jgi:predicted outer membrane repeat protein
MFSQLTRRTLAGLLLSAVGFGTAHAGAIDNITVGQAGLAGNCTVATIQEAINLAAAHPGPDTIWVTRDTPLGYYLAASALTINDPNVEIVGGFDDCFDETPSGYTDISGNGNAADPVFRIRGSSSVRLQNLVITLGDADGTEGAGIDFQGNGVLEIVNSVLEYNNTQGGNFGGGIRVSSSGGGVDLAIANSRINNNTAQSGGGIAFQGTGHVILNNTAVYENAARASGGGLFLQGSGGTISAYLEQGVTISRNSAADDGGGVYAGTQVGLEWNGADGEMWLNTAGDMGGGFYVVNRGATADLFPRGRFNVPTGTYHSVIYGNSARHGGGVAVAQFDRGSGPEANVRLSSYDGLSPQIVAYNQASDLGGAFYVRPDAGSDGYGYACLSLLDTAVIGNTANRGAAVYATRANPNGQDQAAWVYVNYATQTCISGARPRCGAGKECSVFQDNLSAQGAIIDSEGGTNGVLRIRRTKFVGNTGSYLVYLGGGSGTTARMDSSLVASNSLSSGVLLTTSNRVEFVHNTVAGNAISGPVIEANASENFAFSRNIIAQTGWRTLLLNSGTPPVDGIVYNLSNDSGLAQFSGTNSTAEPHLAPNFRPLPISPAVDSVVLDTNYPVDLAGYARPFDRPDVPDSGPGRTADIGAFEIQAGSSTVDAMFANGFE